MNKSPSISTTPHSPPRNGMREHDLEDVAAPSWEEVRSVTMHSMIRGAVLRKTAGIDTLWTQKVGDYKVNVCRRALEYLVRTGMATEAMEWAAILDANGYSTIVWRVLMLCAYKWVGLGTPGLGTVVNDMLIEWTHACMRTQGVDEARLVATGSSAQSPEARRLLMTAVNVVTHAPKDNDVEACVLVKTTQPPNLSVEEWETRSGTHVRFFKTVKESIVSMLPPALRRASLNLMTGLMYGDEDKATTAVTRLFTWGAPVLAWHLVLAAGHTNYRTSDLVVPQECEHAWYLQHGDRPLPVFGWMNETAALHPDPVPFGDWDGDIADMWHSGSYTVTFCIMYMIRVGYGMPPDNRDWVHPVREYRRHVEVRQSAADDMYRRIETMDPAAPREAFVGEPGGVGGVERERAARVGSRGGHTAAMRRAQRKQSRFEEVDEGASAAHTEDDPLFGSIDGRWTVEDFKRYMALRLPVQEVSDAAYEAVLLGAYGHQMNAAYERMMRVVPGSDIMGIRPYLRGMQDRLRSSAHDTPPHYTLTSTRRPEARGQAYYVQHDAPSAEKLRLYFSQLLRAPSLNLTEETVNAEAQAVRDLLRTTLESDPTRRTGKMREVVESVAKRRRSREAEDTGPPPVALAGLRPEAKMFSAMSQYEGVLPPLPVAPEQATETWSATRHGFRLGLVCGPIADETVLTGACIFSTLRSMFATASKGLWISEVTTVEAEPLPAFGAAPKPGVRRPSDDSAEPKLVGMPPGQYLMHEWVRKFDVKSMAYLTQGTLSSLTSVYGLGPTALERMCLQNPEVAWKALAFYWVWGRRPVGRPSGDQAAPPPHSWLVYLPGAPSGAYGVARTDEYLFLAEDSPYGLEQETPALHTQYVRQATDVVSTSRVLRDVLKVWKTAGAQGHLARWVREWRGAFDAKFSKKLKRAGKRPREDPFTARVVQANERLSMLGTECGPDGTPTQLVERCLCMIACNL